LESVWIAALGEWRWGIHPAEFACEWPVPTIGESGRCVSHRGLCLRTCAQWLNS
jgi:hypothetical protein